MSEAMTSPLTNWVGNYVNQVYVLNNNTPFYALATPYLVNFYQNQVRTWDFWNSGYVPAFHSEVRGLIPTGHANSICHKLADLINGDGVIFKERETTMKAEESIFKRNAIDFVSQDFNDRTKMSYIFKDAILKSVQLGNSLVKLNCDSDNELWLDAIAGNRFYVNLDSRGRVVKSRSFVNMYTSGVKDSNGVTDSFGLVEERYYKTLDEPEDLGGKIITKKPVVKFCIYKIAGTANNFTVSETTIPYKDLPRGIQRQFRDEYASVMLDEEQFLPLANLGVFLFKYTAYVENMPNIKLGESAIARVLNQLMMYDTIFSEMYNDLYLSRAKVIVPSFMTGKDKKYLGSGFDGFVFEKISNNSDKDLTPVTFMPKMRVEDFVRMREDICKQIATNIGVATSSIYPDISDARGVVTATEISSEESNTELFKKNKRDLLLPAMNECLDTILGFYGYFNEVDVDFPIIGSSNKHQLVEDTVKLKNARIISTEQALKDIYVNDSQKQIDDKLVLLDEQSLKEQNERVLKYVGVGQGSEMKDSKSQQVNDTKILDK